MKKLILLFTATLITLLTWAQCTPDATLTKPGLKPSRLPNGIAGSAYAEVVTLLVPLDTSVVYAGTTYDAKIDSANVVSITQMPTGFGYVCDKPSRTWNGGQRGCAKLYGNPVAGDTGDYVIKVKVRTFFKITGLPSQLDQLDSSTIDFKIVMPTALQELHQNSVIRAFPNPTGKELVIEMSQYASDASFRIFNLLGEEFTISPAFSPNTGTVKFDVNNLPQGIYLVKGEVNGKTCQTRFVKE